jgi:CspA family cold shock protein
VHTVSEKEFSMNTGTVKFYNDQRGFGFIQPDNDEKDVFVHATALERAGITGLREGQKVAFDTRNDPRNGKTVTGGVNPRIDGAACAGEDKGAVEAPGLFNGMAGQSSGLSAASSV